MDTIIKYYEVLIGEKPEDENGSWMCIKGTRKPTIKEANVFLTKDCEIYGGTVQGVFELPSEEYARLCYDFDNVDSWPVFGQ